MGWPDWRGECAAIVASGPSTKGAGVEKLRGRIHVIAIKENINLCPWADVVYGCDAAWWRHRRGLPEFKGLKLAYDAKVCGQFPDLIRVEIADKKGDEVLADGLGSVGSGGNSGFQALNLAVQFGAKGILLIGFDMVPGVGAHWYGRNNWPMANNPTEMNFVRWRKAFDGAAAGLSARGVDVINASMVSTLKAYPKVSIEEALLRWGL